MPAFPLNMLTGYRTKTREMPSYSLLSYAKGRRNLWWAIVVFLIKNFFKYLYSILFIVKV